MALNDKTLVFVADHSGSPSAIITQSSCRRVSIRENAAAATTRFTIYRPFLSSPGITRPAGDVFVFQQSDNRSLWPPNTTLGYIELLDAVASMAQEED